MKLYEGISNMIKQEIIRLLSLNKVFKIRFRLNIDLVKYSVSFDGDIIEEVKLDKVLSNKSSNQINKNNIDDIIGRSKEWYN
jgi:hypothetical protein